MRSRADTNDTGATKVRLAAGIAVLIALLAVSVKLLPPYIQNWKLQQYVNDLAEDPAMAAQPEVVRARIIDKAGSLGLPVHSSDVMVKRVQNALQIEALYVVHVDLVAYVVDLHFRPAAGGT